MEYKLPLVVCFSLFSLAASVSLDTQLRIIKDVVEKRSVLAKADPVDGLSIEVNIWFNLLFIINLDERRQILTTSGWMDLWWDDPRFAWNASEYGGIDEITVARNQIPGFPLNRYPDGIRKQVCCIHPDAFWVWKPDIVVRNAVNNFNVLGSNDDLIKVFSWGYLEWSPANIYQTICEVDVRTFPFDSQTCFVNFSSWMYYSDELSLNPYGNGVILRHYKGNSEWDLEGLHYETSFYNFSTGYQDGLTIRFRLRRHSTFYILKIIVPTVLLSLLNAFVFVVPVESGEKVSISVTTMLSLTVFLSYIGDVTPNNSDSVPVIALFVVLHLSLGALSIICNIISLNNHFKWKNENVDVGQLNKGSRRSTIKKQMHVFDQDDDVSISGEEINHNTTANKNNGNYVRSREKRILKCEYIDKVLFFVFIIASLCITLFAVFWMIF